MTGYLKAKKLYLAEDYYDYELLIPNREISIAYKSEIIKKLSMKQGKFSSYAGDYAPRRRLISSIFMLDKKQDHDELKRNLERAGGLVNKLSLEEQNE